MSPTNSVVLIVLLALMMGVDSFRQGGWAIVRPVTTIARLILILGAAATVVFGRGIPSWLNIAGALVGCAAGLALALLAARAMTFRKDKTELMVRTNLVLATLPLLILVIRILLVGPANWLPSPTGLRSGALVSLSDFLFLSYWTAVYLLSLVRGDHYLRRAAAIE